jgi:hypothetical protein
MDTTSANSVAPDNALDSVHGCYVTGRSRGVGLTSPVCGSLSQKFLKVTGTGWIEFACWECGCRFTVKNQKVVMILKQSKEQIKISKS